MRKIENHQCPAYNSTLHRYPVVNNQSRLALGVRWRTDWDYARELVALPATEGDMSVWSPYGWCERPRMDLYVGF